MGQEKNIDCKVERLTEGPKHHLFGFHDLIISNKADSKYLCLEVDAINRPPLAGEMFGVGYVENGQFVKVGETTALNYPQGARQQWVADTELFTVNNRVGDVWGTDLYDASSNKLLDRFDATTHMLSKEGRYAYGLDYARLFRVGGYGYNGIADSGEYDIAPSNSGISVLDLKTKEKKIIVAVREAAECGQKKAISGSSHYLTHLSLNPSCTRIAFLHRYSLPDGGGITRLMTIGVDGTELRCIAQGFLSHFDWKDDNHIYIFGRANSSLDSLRDNKLLSYPIVSSSLKIAKKVVKAFVGSKANNIGKSFMMITDSDNPEIRPFAQDIIPLDGHPMTNPKDNNWCVSDTYPDANGDRVLMLYNFDKDIRYNLGTFRMIFDKPDMSLRDQFFRGVDLKMIVSPEDLAFTRSGLHCDLHPRWNSLGTEAVFDSIHEGTRQIYRINVGQILKDTL